MHPVNAKKLSYLRAQASILRSTGLSVKEISKKLKKSELWVVKWSSRNDGFEDKKRTGRPKILNKAAKRILNKAKYKRGNSTRQLSQRLASRGHVGQKTPSRGLWKAKVGDRWEGKRNLCSQPSSVQLDWNLLSSTKTSLWKNGMIFFFRTNVPNICFSCPIQKMILFGVLRKAKFLQHIRLKKVQSGSYGAEWQAAVSLGYIFYPKDRLWLPIATSTTY